jgi:hypothetical protein|tara:strand:- start:3840 stop:4163 length:324 start_codon:yes stop_codon:yes gene_type:complete
MNRLFCGTCKRKTNHCGNYHCLEHDGWQEIDKMKRITDSLRKELNEWKEKWAKEHLRALKLTDFYGNPDNWKADEYDNILAIIDSGQLARDLATLDYNKVDPLGTAE